MTWLEKAAKGIARVRVSALALGLLVFSPDVLQAAGFTFTGLSGDFPIGIAPDPGVLLVTNPFCVVPQQVFVIGPSGTVSGTVTLPSSPPPGLSDGGCEESYIATVPNASGFAGAGWTPHDAYVTEGQNIFHLTWPIPPGTPTLFTTIPAAGTSPAANNGIGFDDVGLFGNDMIVTAAAARRIYRVNSGGTPTLAVTFPGTVAVNGPIESPAVAPLTFGGFPGWLFVVSEMESAAYAVSPPPVSPATCPPPSTSVACVPGPGDPGATCCKVNTMPIPGAESIRFIPSAPLCRFGTGTIKGSFFTVNFDATGVNSQVFAVPDTDFAGLTDGMHAVVTQEGPNAAMVLSASGTTTPASFSLPGQPEGSTFCR